MSRSKYKTNPGVYNITNIVNGKFYIGSTIYLNRRKSSHFRDLENNKHPSQHLQNAYNKYGSSVFIFEILETCEDNKKVLIEREQFYLDTLLFAQEYIRKEDKKFLELGYNINPVAYSPEKRIVSLETRAKMSQKSKGRKHSKETKLKLSKMKMNVKFSEETKSKMRKPKSEKHKMNMRLASKNRKYDINHGLLSLIGRKVNIIINNIEYLSCNEASKILDISRATIYRRICSSKYPTYKYKYNE